MAIGNRVKSRLGSIDLATEGRRTWRAFEQLSQHIPGFSELQQTGQFYIIDGAVEGKNLYTYFPFLFAEAFPELTRAQLRQLSLMALVYLYHILINDLLMDEKPAQLRAALLVSSAYQLKAFEILDGLLKDRRIDWSQVEKMHRAYSRATLLEAQDHIGKLSVYQSHDLLRMLSAKSSMAKLILLGLCKMSGRADRFDTLARSFDWYYLGDQLFDDFRDWKADLQNGKFTYLLTRVIADCRLREQAGFDCRHPDVEMVGKQLYLSGIAEGYLNEVIESWKRAREFARDINCPRWIGFLNSLQLGVGRTRAGLAQNARQLLLQPATFAYRLSAEDRREIADDDTSAGSSDSGERQAPLIARLSRDVLTAGNRARDFIRRAYVPGIGLADFFVFDQELSGWVAGYAGCSLIDWLGRKAGPGKGKRSKEVDFVRRLAAEIAPLQTERGWSTCGQSPEDADTTAWILNFLMAGGYADRVTIESGVNSLLQYQCRDGGFRTYQPQSVGRGSTGWSSSHPEVTAIVVEVLIKAGLDARNGALRRAIDYLEQRRGADLLWPSYWWDSDVYATYHALRALRANGNRLAGDRDEELIDRLLSRQQSDGGWGGETAARNRPFETALAVRTLLLLDSGDLLLDSGDAARDVLEQAVVWLLTWQSSDGGWDSQPMMRVPAMTDRRPWERPEWALDLSNGVGVLVRDQNRLFTTATVLGALADYVARRGNQYLAAGLKPHLELPNRRVRSAVSAIN